MKLHPTGSVNQRTNLIQLWSFSSLRCNDELLRCLRQTDDPAIVYLDMPILFDYDKQREKEIFQDWCRMFIHPALDPLDGEGGQPGNANANL